MDKYHAFINYITHYKEHIGNIALLVGAISAFNVSILLPIIFNFYIVPSIERKVNTKLTYTSFVYKYLTGRFAYWLFRYLDISWYIIMRCFGSTSEFEERIYLQPFTLANVHYERYMFTKLEILLSFLSMISVVLFILSGILLIFYPVTA